MEPVLTYAPDGVPARAYPLRYLTWHEIVNDTVAGVPDRRDLLPLVQHRARLRPAVEGAVLTFGVSGNLRHSDMVMFDRETESWWQQATGEGIVGAHAGTPLEPLVSWVESWESFREAHPDGLVMAGPTPTAPMAAIPMWATTARPSPSSISVRCRPTTSRRSNAGARGRRAPGR
jgi:hypothetical protein